MEFDVFLSHNSKDKAAVRELKTLLQANKLKAWFDEDELQPGIPWQRLLEAGIKNSTSVAVLVGKDGLGPWEDEEMQAALILAVKDKRPCIPVLLPGAGAQPELPMFLGNRTWVDLRAGFNDEGLNKLIWGITAKKPEQRVASGPAQEPGTFSGQLKDSTVFYLFASPISAWDESCNTLFYRIRGESQAVSLCRLFTREYGDADLRVFHCRADENFSLDEQVLFDETLEWLSNYDDPDPGIYDPRPSADMFARAQYGVRARTWEELLARRT